MSNGMTNRNPLRCKKFFSGQGIGKKPQTVRALALALLFFLAAAAHAQTAPAASAPRPLEALGMSYPDLKSYLGPCEKDKLCRLHAREAELGHRATFDLPPYTYTIEAGKVIEVMITADSFDAFIAEGKEKWGPPAKLEYQNLVSPFGEETRVGSAHWDLPGGITADAQETKFPGKIIGVTKTTTSDHSPVRITQREPPLDGAIVVIRNPSAQQAGKPKLKRVL